MAPTLADQQAFDTGDLYFDLWEVAVSHPDSPVGRLVAAQAREDAAVAAAGY